MQRFLAPLRGKVLGDGLGARAFRGSMLTVLSFGGQNVLRLVGNIILTRILFPEAFGLMALVQVVLAGLAMLSDFGVFSAIVQSRRGDEPAFLDTAFTLNILRGLLLWIATIGLAVPVANFYDAPMLAWMLPVAGLTTLADGLVSTRMWTAERHMMLGRVTALSLGTGVLSLIVTILLAWEMQSVWALVLGGVFGAFLKAALSHVVLVGHRNRIRFDPAIAWQLIGFGKWILLSTVAGLVVNQGDRAILGKFVSLADLGIYNIGYFLGAVPMLLGGTLMAKIVFPLYARMPPVESAHNRRKINAARRALTAALILGVAALALLGDPLVRFLYDARYQDAGPVVILVALALLPVILTAGYHNLPLAAGHSRRFAAIVTALAALQSVLMFWGASRFGIGGVAIAPGLAALLFWPVLILAIRRYKGWDPVQDIGLGMIAAILATIVIWIRWDVIAPLFTG